MKNSIDGFFFSSSPVAHLVDAAGGEGGGLRGPDGDGSADGGGEGRHLGEVLVAYVLRARSNANNSRGGR